MSFETPQVSWGNLAEIEAAGGKPLAEPMRREGAGCFGRWRRGALGRATPCATPGARAYFIRPDWT